MLTRKQISLIHVAKQKLGMKEDEYKAMLSRFGVFSSLDLKPEQFDECIRLMRGWGFEGGGQKAAGSRTDDGGRTTEGGFSNPPKDDDKSRLLGKIGALLRVLELPWNYADGISMNMFRVRKVKWLHGGQLRRVVAALVYHQNRQKTKEVGDGNKSDLHEAVGSHAR
jgi:phage gp16-like protein